MKEKIPFVWFNVSKFQMEHDKLRGAVSCRFLQFFFRFEQIFSLKQTHSMKNSAKLSLTKFKMVQVLFGNIQLCLVFWKNAPISQHISIINSAPVKFDQPITSQSQKYDKTHRNSLHFPINFMNSNNLIEIGRSIFAKFNVIPAL